MKCHGCSSPMILDQSETKNRVTTEWHRCTVCNKVHMHSELVSLNDVTADSRWKDLEESNADTSADKSPVAYAPRQGISYV